MIRINLFYYYYRKYCFLILVLLEVLFLFVSLKLFENLCFLFSLKFDCLVRQKDFKLGFFILFFLKFFVQPSLYWSISVIALLVKITNDRDFYLNFSLGLHYFFDQNILIVQVLDFLINL